jgi:nicotinamide-nucleotide amidase
MRSSVSFLTVGSEILDGRIVDTNVHYLRTFFVERGFETGTCATCTDRIDHIVESLQFLLRHSRAVIITGGLGPTSDDLTREGIAAFFNDELITDPLLVRDLHEKYRARGRTCHPSNLRQAMRPSRALSVPNEMGTAPGLFIEGVDGSLVAAVPGIPKELKPMVDTTILPLFIEKLSPRTMYSRSVTLLGLPESEIGGKVASLNLEKDIEISYRVKFPEVIVQLRNQVPVDEAFSRVTEVLEPSCQVCVDSYRELSEIVVQILMDNKLTLSVTESCTGGLVGDLITNVPGSSQVFLGGFVAYSNKFKEKIVGISHDTLKNEGAVSGKCVAELALQTRLKTQSSIGISISGIAGPAGGSPEKPVGTFWVGYSSGEATGSYRFFFPSERTLLKRFAAYKALDVMRRALLKLPDPFDTLENDFVVNEVL